MAPLALLAASTIPMGMAAAAAHRLFRSGGVGADWLSGLASARDRAAAASSASAPSSSSSSSSSCSSLSASVAPRELHRWIAPAPPARRPPSSPPQVVTLASGALASLPTPTPLPTPLAPLLAPGTLTAAAFALLFASGASVMAEVWREAHILRPPRPALDAVPSSSSFSTPSLVARLEAAVDEYSAQERRLAAQLRGQQEARSGSAGSEEVRERLQEARVVKAALERELWEQRRKAERERRRRQRQQGGAAAA
jgi:hypothetical protein